MNLIYAMRPINKIAAVVVNQSGCATELELNNLIEQRRLLKANATVWMLESSKSKGARRRNSALIKHANRELVELNKKLKAYDNWHRQKTPKNYDNSFRMEVKRVFGDDIFKQLELQAKASCDV